MTGHVYALVSDYATTVVFICMVILATRRIVFPPARYEVPRNLHGKAHTADAVFVLALIAALMLADSLFAASAAALQMHQGQPHEFVAAWSLPWMLTVALSRLPCPRSSSLVWLLSRPRLGFFLSALLSAIRNSVPMSKLRYSVSISRKLDRGTLKPVTLGSSRRPA